MTSNSRASSREKLISRRKMLRDAIRQAAIEEFSMHGFTGASTLAIAQRAGLTKPQLHYYISSKEELYEEVLEHIVKQWREIYLGAMDPADPEKTIRTYIRKKLEFGHRYPSSSRLFANEIMAGAPFLQQHWHPFREAIRRHAEIIQSWVDRKLIKPVDPMMLQMHMWAVTQHYADFEVQVRFLMDIDDEEDLDLEHIVDEVTRLFLRAVGLSQS